MNKNNLFLQQRYNSKKVYICFMCMILLGITSNLSLFSQILDDADFDELSVLVEEKYERIVQSQFLSDTQFQIAKALVAESETYRGNIKKDFVFLLSIQETIDKQVKNETDIKTYVHPVDNARSRYVISQFLSGTSVNTLVLQREFNMWFFKPGTRNPIRISSSQRLIGGASYADVSNTNYNEYYDPIEVSFESIGNVTAYKVVLAKKQNGVAYEKIEYFIEQKSKRPIKAEFYSRSGRLLKTMYYRNFGKIQDRTLSKEWIIVDGINKSAVTYIRVNDILYESLNAALYTPERIKEF